MALISDSKGTGRLQLSMTRIVIVWFFLIATTAVIVSRLLWIQVLHPEKLIAEGNMRVLRSYHYEPPRGLITDRNGRILAISIPVKTVIADPKRLTEEGFYNDPKNIEKVSAILEIQKDVLAKKIENRTKRYALLKNYLDPEKAKELKAISKKDSNREVIYGKNTVNEVLESKRKVFEVIVTDAVAQHDAGLMELVEKQKISCKCVSL